MRTSRASPAGVTIRPAEPRDLMAVGRLGALLMRTHFRFDSRRFMAPGPHPERAYASFLDGELRSPTVAVLVAEHDGEIVGYVYAGIEPLSWKELREEAGFVHDLVVAVEARGKGIGAALLEAAVAWLQDRGVPRVMLWTAPQNQAAQRLFARHGFRPTMIEMTHELA